MWTSLFAAALLFGQPSHRFEVANHRFELDGKPFQIIAGEIHLSRVPRALWRQRLKMAKAMGLNTISAYIFWNELEPEKGLFRFAGEQDVAEFIQECAQEGLYVVLRPGPYVCAEWDFGGYPYWLLTEPGIKIRSTNSVFMGYARRYLSHLATRLAPLQVTRGGPILMVQVENEYGSYGSDHRYMEKCRNMLKEVGFDVPLFVAEGGDQLAKAWVPGTVAGVNGGGWPNVKSYADKYTPGGPYFVPEFYPGWLDHWGEPKSKTDGDVPSFKSLIANGVSVSLYMFFGGTNFGWTNGANYSDHFQPDMTSYDYDAPLSEDGTPTPKYMAFREAISQATHHEPPAVPASPRRIAVSRFRLTAEGALLDALPSSITAPEAKPMEELGQAYGEIDYRTHVDHSGRHTLDLQEVRDYAVVMVNGQPVANLDRRLNQHQCTIDVPAGGAELDVLVENGGRINYGERLPDNKKGATKPFLLDSYVLGWQSYSLPMVKAPQAHPRLARATTGPTVYGGSFQLSSVGETFLDFRGWAKGVAWINGHALGRFWSIGPQQTLYVPSCWLKKGRNEVEVVALAANLAPSLEGLDHPVLDELNVGDAH